jgi:hypothetical protein
MFGMRRPAQSSQPGVTTILANRTGLTLQAPALLFLGYLVFYGLFFSPAWIEGRSLAPGDGLAFYRPHYLPKTLWEPNLMTGFPVAADPQVMTWYPPSLLLSWVAGTWNSFIISAYVIASWFTCLYVLALTENLLAGIFSGLIYGLSGFFMAHLGHATMIHSAAWLPAMLLAAEKLRSGYGTRWIAFGTAATGSCIFAGHTQIAVYGLWLVGAYVLTMGIRELDCSKYYFSAYGFMVLGIALAAVQIAPAAELSTLTVRSSLSFPLFTEYSLSWLSLPTLVFPWLLTGGGAQGQQIYFGPWNLTELAGFAGYSILLLTAMALSARRKHPAVRFWLFAGICGLCLSLGGSTPLGKVLFHLPIVNLFRALGRFLLIFDLSAAVLAGCGLHAVLTQPQLRERFTRISILMLACLFVLTFAVSFIFGPHLQTMAANKGVAIPSLRPWENPTVGIPLLFGMLATSLLGFLLGNPKSRSAQICFLLASVAELGTFGWFAEWRYLSPLSSDFQMPPALARERGDLLRSGGRWLPTQGFVGRRLEAPPDLSRLWNIPSVSKYGPLLPRRIHELLTLESTGWLTDHWADGANRAFDLVGARYVVLPPSSLKRPEVLNGANAGRWSFVEELEGSRIVENMRARPRTWLVSETILLPAGQILRAIQTSQLPDGRAYDPAVMALIEEPRAFNAGGKDRSGTAQITLAANTRVEIRTHTSQPAFLVLADFNYPGWRCTVNGEKAPIYTTNYIQRGVFVPTGTSTIEFSFQPSTVYFGAGVSATTLLVLGYLCKRSAP